MVSVFLSSACGKKDIKQYDAIIASMEAGEAYAFVEFPKYEYPILLISEWGTYTHYETIEIPETGTYTYSEDIEASCICDVYYIWENEARYVGKLSSAGTAYPIAYNEDGFYVGNMLLKERYVLDKVEKKLKVDEYSDVKYDDDGNDVYFYGNMEQATDDQVEMDDPHLLDFESRNRNAEVIQFTQID